MKREKINSFQLERVGKIARARNVPGAKRMERKENLSSGQKEERVKIVGGLASASNR